MLKISATATNSVPKYELFKKDEAETASEGEEEKPKVEKPALRVERTKIEYPKNHSRIEIVRNIKYVDAVVPQYDMNKLEMCKKLGASLSSFDHMMYVFTFFFDQRRTTIRTFSII